MSATIKPTDLFEHVFQYEDTIISILYNTGSATLGVPTNEFHTHTCCEFFYCKKGSQIFHFENENVELKENELIITAPLVRHYTTRQSTSTLSHFMFTFRKSSVRTSVPVFRHLESIIVKPYVKMKIPGLDISATNISKSENITDTFSIFDASDAIHTLFGKIIRKATEGQKQPLAYTTSDNRDVRMYKIDTMITHYTDTDISLEAIASSINLSTRQTRRIIEDYYGCPFSKIVSQKKMEHAAILLRRNDMKISQIAAKVGYRSTKGFYTTFKKHYGCLPSEYREKHSNDKN